MDKNKTGLIVGYFLALVHLVWALAVIIMPDALQAGINWIFKIHGLMPVWIITSLSILDALLLVIMTFISGYILGWVFAWINGMCHKKK
jgi:hypothetical protein